jgi:hypothetical protein
MKCVGAKENVQHFTCIRIFDISSFNIHLCYLCYLLNYTVSGRSTNGESSLLRLIQIVPNLPPLIDGIGDHAFCLAQRLREFHDIETSFVVGNPRWKGPSEIDGFSIVQIPARSGANVVRAIQEVTTFGTSKVSAILVQFAPYGYAPKGNPSWIVDGIIEVTKATNIPVMTMFHELDVGKRNPWESAFWISPFQRILLQRLARISACRITNTEFHRNKLHKWGVQNVTLLPSFSTIGEPSFSLPLMERQKQLIVFGRPWQRMHTYNIGRHAIRRMSSFIEFDRIIDVGDPIAGDDEKTIEGFPIIRYGSLPSSGVSDLMGSSVAGLLSYPVPLLTKSSIYGALCAHGTLPIIVSDNSLEYEETQLELGLDYILGEDNSNSSHPGDLSEISKRVFARYNSRNSASAAKQIRSLIQQL